MKSMGQKTLFCCLLCMMLAAGFFCGSGCKPNPGDNCTGLDNATTPQPAYGAVESFSAVFGRNSDPADVYYPADADNATKLPMALLLQGGRCGRQYYSMFAGHVAAYGFIVVVPDHYHQFKLGPIDTDGLFSEGTQMQDCIDYLTQQNDNSSSPLFQMVDTEKLMMLGHSYGAACTIYAIQNNCEYPFCTEDEAPSFQRPEELKAAALCGINTKPRGKPFDYRIYPTANNGIPLAFVNGSLDNNARSGITRISYSRIADPPKMLVLITGANHYASLDVNNPPAPGPGLGKGPGEDPNQPAISQEVSTEIAARWCALFLRAYGLQDPLAKLYVEQTGTCLDDQVEVLIEAP